MSTPILQSNSVNRYSWPIIKSEDCNITFKFCWSSSEVLALITPWEKELSGFFKTHGSFKNDSTSFYQAEDFFIDAGIKADLKQYKIAITASYLNIGPDFFSVGAQSKRVEFKMSETQNENAEKSIIGPEDVKIDKLEDQNTESQL